MGSGPTVVAADSHIRRFVEPMERQGYTVDILVATYQCPSQDVENWLAVYGDRKVSVDAVLEDPVGSETQRDTLFRGLRLVEKAQLVAKAQYARVSAEEHHFILKIDNFLPK